jgi:hypothetical protein
VVNGDWFAEYATTSGGKLKAIAAKIVNGTDFAFAIDGGKESRVGIIVAEEVNGDLFAYGSGDMFDSVETIAAKVVNGKEFSHLIKIAGHFYKNGENGTKVYDNAMKKVKEELAKYGIDWGESK